MVRTILFFLIMATFIGAKAQNNNGKLVSINGMEVRWTYTGDRISFKLRAPTSGWLAIGFNESTGLKDTYLLMGHVVNNKPNVVEHYTLSPGKYVPLTSLGAKPNVQNIDGSEDNGETTIIFSLPIKQTNKYQKKLTQGSKYNLILAYSQSDDFQHHSIMRTATKVEFAPQ